MKLARTLVAAGMGSMLAGLAPVAGAQTAPAPPPSQVVPPPGAVPTRQEVAPDQGQPAPKGEVHVHEAGAFSAGPCPLSQSDVKVAITQIQFTGPGGAPLAPDIAALLQSVKPAGDTRSIAQVCELRDAANAALQHARYVAAVQIPPQTIDGGILKLEVITGHIVEVHVHGDAGPFEGEVRKRIEALKALTPLNAADAERVLLQANDIPGLTIQMGLSPDTASGKAGDLIGDMTVSYKRFALIANVQNYNSTALGRESLYLRAEAYDLLGLNDRTFLAGSTTFDFRKQKMLQFGETIRLNSNNDHLSFVSTFAESRPALPQLDLRTTTLIESLSYDHTFVRTASASVIASSGLEWAQQTTKIYLGNTATPLNRDRVTTLYARVDANKRFLRFDGGERAELSGSLELRKGLGVFGATKPGSVVDGYTPSRYFGSATPFVVRARLGGVIGLGPIFELSSQEQGQWTDKQLLNYDEFAVGNLTVGRGYDPGANTTDRALASANEIRANLPTGDKVHAQIYGFFDWVRLWSLDPNAQIDVRHHTMRSVGGGARLTVVNGLKLDVTYAHPLDPPHLTSVDFKRPPNRLMVSLTAQLWPFGFHF